tara:strand:+ start:4290 stop:5063 length:774 start_codon:yes stop_codon:yes gene_type:complete
LDLKMNKPQLSTHGYEILSADKLDCLDDIRNFIAKSLVDEYKPNMPPKTSSEVLNNAHKIANIHNDSEANSMVLDIIKLTSKEHDFSDIVYQTFQSAIEKHLGPDLHAQRNNNIVFQCPDSDRYSELHTDCPPNSPFELVFWVPLVDCYASKSFYLVPLAKTKALLEEYRSTPDYSWDDFKNECVDCADHLEINYGSAIVFWTGLIHGSLSNSTSESRWCINARFKNLYAPCGQHNPLTYYRIFKTSSISELALDFS